jgi:RHS repeat-associated protein
MATVDGSGTLTNAYTYDVYGKTTSASGSQANDFQFAGQQTDVTGLQYLRARYYDPATGGFLSRDPLAKDAAWAGQPFGYAGANPVNNVDPTGLCFGPKALCKAGGAIRDNGRAFGAGFRDVARGCAKDPILCGLAGEHVVLAVGIFDFGFGIAVLGCTAGLVLCPVAVIAGAAALATAGLMVTIELQHEAELGRERGKAKTVGSGAILIGEKE